MTKLIFQLKQNFKNLCREKKNFENRSQLKIDNSAVLNLGFD